jgi:hypothetical protein
MSNKKETYVAIHLEGTQEDDIGGFNSNEEAWDYIRDYCICSNCKEELFHSIYYDIEDTGCGSEWDVLPLSKYQKLTNRKNTK